MSDTKTTQRLAGFDQYRTRRTLSQRIVAIAVRFGLPLLILIVAGCSQGTDPESPAPGGQPSTSASPTLVSGRSEGFEAPFTYTLQAGWALGGDGERYFGFEGPGSANLLALSSVVPARSDCSARPKPGVGTSSDDMTSWLSRHPALDATEPVDITLGAASGSRVDVQLDDDWEQSCPDGLVLVTGRPDGEEGWEIHANEKIRFYVLDVPAGDAVTIVMSASPREFDEMIDEVAPVVESFEFIG